MTRGAIPWSRGRIAILTAKAAGEKIAAFERRCAWGQLLAATGDFAQASAELIAVLREFAHLYPDNGHVFTQCPSARLWPSSGIAERICQAFEQRGGDFHVLLA